MTAVNVLHVIPSLSGGGSERSLCESLQEASRRMTSQVVVFHRRPGDAVDEVRGWGIGVRHVTARSLPGRIRAVMQAIREAEADLVHVSVAEAEFPARLAGRLLGVPVVSVLANTTYDPVRFDDPAVGRWRLRAHQVLDAATAHACVSMFRAVSESAAEDARRHLLVPSSRIAVIPRGRSEEALRPISEEDRLRARAALGLPTDAFVVGTTSRREFQKGLDVAVEAVAQLRARGVPARFVHAGRPGNGDTALHAAIAAADVADHVDLLGHRDDAVRHVLPAFDVFVFPSRYEGLPGALLEAAGRQLPIVASDIGPNRDLLGTCLDLVPRDDPGAFADALQRLHLDPVHAQELARRCHDWVRSRHRISDVVDQELALYERVAERGRRCPSDRAASRPHRAG